MIYLTSETRWKAERDEEKCFLKNYPFIKEIAENFQSKTLTKGIRNTLSDEELIDVHLPMEIKKLDPVCDFIDKVQS